MDKIMYKKTLLSFLIIFTLILAACSTNTDKPINIKVELKEGFTGERVVVLLDNKAIYDDYPVTRTTIGSRMAGRFTFDAKTSKVYLKFKIPDKKLEQVYEFDVAKGTLLAVSLKNGRFEFSQPNLFIDMQGGFFGNEVQILVNGKEIFNNKIETNAIVGLAGATDVELTGTSIKLHVIVKDLKLEKEFKLKMSDGSFIGVQLCDNDIKIKQQYNHFMYD